jgi:hypothetical protein
MALKRSAVRFRPRTRETARGPKSASPARSFGRSLRWPLQEFEQSGSRSLDLGLSVGASIAINQVVNAHFCFMVRNA